MLPSGGKQRQAAHALVIAGVRTEVHAATARQAAGGGLLPYVIVIAVIAVIAVGAVLFQRRSRWDELG